MDLKIHRCIEAVKSEIFKIIQVYCSPIQDSVFPGGTLLSRIPGSLNSQDSYLDQPKTILSMQIIHQKTGHKKSPGINARALL
jgi:hypothetical protein